MTTRAYQYGFFLLLMLLGHRNDSALAVDQGQVDQSIQWFQQSGMQKDPTTLQQTFDANQGAFCGNGGQGCNAQSQTQGLQNLKQDPAGLTQQGVNAFNDPSMQPVRDFQRSAPLDKNNVLVTTSDAIIGAQTDVSTNNNAACALRSPTITKTCQAGYGAETYANRIDTLVLDNVKPPQTTAASQAQVWSCGSGVRGSGLALGGVVFASINCFYTFEIVSYSGTGLVIGGAAGQYNALIVGQPGTTRVTIPEGPPFSIQLTSGGSPNGNITTFLPVTATGQYQNGTGSVTFTDGRETVTLPIRYGGQTATDRWVTESDELDPSCGVAATTCLDGPSTKLWTASDGQSYPFTRDCWAREITASCRGSYFDQCATYRQNPLWQQLSATCVEQDSQGCRRTEETWVSGGQCQSLTRTNLGAYEASIPGQSGTTGNAATAISNLAITQELYRSIDDGGTCTKCDTEKKTYQDAQQAFIKDPTNPLLQEAAHVAERTYQSCLGEQCSDSTDDGAGNVTIFNGTDYACKRNSLGCNECACKGLCSSFGLCDKNDKKSFINRKEKGLCHFVGDYTKKKTLGLVKETTSRYCCFNSKLARIIHEQGRPQLDWSWGTAETPDCGAFSLDQGSPHFFGKLDFSRMDLSEYINDVKITLPDQQKLTDRLKQGVQNATQ